MRLQAGAMLRGCSDGTRPNAISAPFLREPERADKTSALPCDEREARYQLEPRLPSILFPAQIAETPLPGVNRQRFPRASVKASDFSVHLSATVYGRKKCPDCRSSSQLERSDQARFLC